MERPLILISNDDGINATGIKYLAELASTIGDVFVVAPAEHQSGMSHALTFNNPIRIKEMDFPNSIKAYSCAGTPVDCVKIALSNLMPKIPDLVLSGINHGCNGSISVLYSGTLAASTEGSIKDIPSIGFSLYNYTPEPDFTQAKDYILKIIKTTLKNGLPKNTSLNVNIPDVAKEEIKGIKACKQAEGRWQEDFIKRTDPSNKEYYWLSGDFIIDEKSDEGDMNALNNNYITVVPIKTDHTDYDFLKTLKEVSYD